MVLGMVWLSTLKGIGNGLTTKNEKKMTTDEILEQREALLDDIQDIYEVALDLVECVEKYVRQETSRATLIWKKNKLKKLIEG